MRLIPFPSPEDPASSGGGAAPEDPAARISALLGAAALGDQEAFGALYDETSRRVHGVVLAVLRDPSQAEEVTQEVYLEAWRTASRYDPRLGSPATWLATMAHRRAVDRVRSAESAKRRDSEYGTRQVEVTHDQTADEVHAAIEARRVRDALASLTPAQRDAIQLAYFRGCTHTEVATLLDIPLGTAKTRIRDGLIRLRDTLGVA